MKRKVLVTLGLITAFFITGTVGYAEEPKLEDLQKEIEKLKKAIIKKDGKGNIIINGGNDFSNIDENSWDNILIGYSHKVKMGGKNILVGYNNEIESGNNSLIIGKNNKVPNHGKYNNNDSVVIFGEDNEVIDSQFSTVQGEYNKLDDSHRSLVNGYENKVIKSAESQVFGQGNEVNDSGKSYINGYENKVSENSFHTNLTGYKNEVKGGSNAFVIGDSNKIEYSSFSSIVGSDNSIIGDGVDESNAPKYSNNHIQGVGSNITESSNSAIIAGYFSSVNMSNSVAIGAFSSTKAITNLGYLTNQSTDDVYALAVGGEYKYKDNEGNERIFKSKRRIQGLADGAEDDEAVTVAQLKKLESKIGGAKVDEALNKSNTALGGVSNAISMANLVQLNSYSRHRHNLSAAYGYYGGSHALAIGFSGTNEKRDFVYKLSGSVNNHGNLALGIGAGVMLGNSDDDYPAKADKIKKLYNEVDELKKSNEELRKENMEIKELLQKILNKNK